MHAIQGAMAVRRERMKRDDRDRRRMSGVRNGAACGHTRDKHAHVHIVHS